MTSGRLIIDDARDYLPLFQIDRVFGPYDVALALTLLAPILVNILLYHALIEPGSIAPGLVASVLWFILYTRERAAFAGLFQASTPATL